MQIVAVITARGNSKSIRGKNLVQLGGQPLISWTIQAARACTGLSRIMVSTDCDQIRQQAERFGAEVPFLRPPELAGDRTPHIDVILHALQWLWSEACWPDYVLLLQPTSPLRTSDDIQAAMQIACRYRPPSVVSVCPVIDHPMLTKRMCADGTITDFVPATQEDLRRQALPPAFVLNGALYLTRSDVLTRLRTFCPPGSIPYLMPRERSLDIDTPADLTAAQAIFHQPPRKSA